MRDKLSQLISLAWTRVLTQAIYKGGALTVFLERECQEQGIQFEVAYAEALSSGLYRYLGSRYQSALTAVIGKARDSIDFGLILDEDELRRYLDDAAHSAIPHMPSEKVLVDLMIDARQSGLFDLLVNVNKPARRDPLGVITQVA